MIDQSSLNRAEIRAAVTLATVFFLRLLGLFMLISVLALYTDRLEAATPTLIGLAIGIYGLTQALLQIPLGMIIRPHRPPAGHHRRTPGISTGGVIAAASSHIVRLILGRAVQGAGAISGATLALAADLCREEQRTKVMAIIGISIGAAFSLTFMIDPAIDAAAGLRGIFLCSAGSGVAAMLVTVFAVAQTRSRRRAGRLFHQPVPGHVRRRSEWWHRRRNRRFSQRAAGQHGSVSAVVGHDLRNLDHAQTGARLERGMTPAHGATQA